MVRERMSLIQGVQTKEWWQDVTTPILESMRRRLRDLVKLIEKQHRTLTAAGGSMIILKDTQCSLRRA
jgi:type I site-specific restriction endonuclease